MAKPVRQILYKVGTSSYTQVYFFYPGLVDPWSSLAGCSCLLFFMLPFFFCSALFLRLLSDVMFLSLILLLLLLLSQLRKLAYAIKNSTTIILPWWNEAIEHCAATLTSKKKLIVRKMPWDVDNQWNSTYDMLKFAFTYSEPINNITGNRSMKIHQYELQDHEWTIVEQLWDCLKVRICFF